MSGQKHRLPYGVRRRGWRAAARHDVGVAVPTGQDLRALVREAPTAIRRCHPRGTPGRVGTPEGVAVVVAFLAAAEPPFMTGEVIDVDGGADIN